jgi:hypothetical protein
MSAQKILANWKIYLQVEFQFIDDIRGAIELFQFDLNERKGEQHFTT